MNQSEHTAAPPSPEHLFETLNAYQKSAGLKAAIELDLFTAIAKGKTSATHIARACGANERGGRMSVGADERGGRILCDYLVVNGFLTKGGFKTSSWFDLRLCDRLNHC